MKDYVEEFRTLIQRIEQADQTKRDCDAAIRTLRANFREEVLAPLCTKYAVAWVDGTLYQVRLKEGRIPYVDFDRGLDTRCLGYAPEDITTLAGGTNVYPSKLVQVLNNPLTASLLYKLDHEPFPTEPPNPEKDQK